MPDNDEAIFARAVSGDPNALSDLLDRFGPQVERRLAGKLNPQWRSAMDIEDIMQVTFLEVFLQVDRLQARDGNTFMAWLTRIAEHNMYDAIRGLQAEKRPQPSKRVQIPDRDESFVALLEAIGGTLTSPSQNFAKREVVDLITAALERLPDDYRNVIRLYDLEGHSGPEVAKAIGKSRGAVHMLRARAMDRLRDELGPDSMFFTDPA